MKRLLALALALAMLPSAAAQFMERPGMIVAPVPGGPDIDMPLYAELRIESRDKDFMPIMSPWFTVGLDTVVNLTVRNNREEPLNATFRLNVTGATATPDEIVFALGAYGAEGKTFAIHPDDSGLVEISAEAIDAFLPSGEPVRAQMSAPATLLPTARFLDPPPVAPAGEDDEFQQIDSYRGPRMGISAYARIRPGESITPAIELANPFQVAIPGFRLTVQAPTNSGQYSQSVEVPAMEAGTTRTIELDEFEPVEDNFGGGFYGGPVGSFELRPTAEFSIGGQPFAASVGTFRIDRGAVLDLSPAVAVVDVQDGVAIDLSVPRKPVLGAPTRVLYNLTNLQTTPAQGTLVLTISTPGNLFYETQGPETHNIPVTLAPGEVRSGSIDVTPRVTGQWSVNSLLRSERGYGWGGGGGFEVKGPLVLGFDQQEQVFARIGEPVEIGISLASSETLQDAQLRITSGSGYYRDPGATGGGEFRPGFADSLIQSRSLTSSLGTLRPGGSLNASIEVTGRSSGYYTIVPYVLSEGFAYTSTPTFDPGKPIPFDDHGINYYATMLSIQVQPRPVPAALSLAPLTLALAFFVGAWTLRTRFVR